ncbi:MAG: hypothetical protein NTW21_03225 [Verrucomicrobia bacterium]|nr:hypothetical protein [Verrucomicrobiota bacterium]
MIRTTHAKTTDSGFAARHRGAADAVGTLDRGDGKGYTLLAYDSTPGYADTTPLPATPAKWKYKAIYRVGDERVGLWSAEVSIAVGA